MSVCDNIEKKAKDAVQELFNSFSSAEEKTRACLGIVEQMCMHLNDHEKSFVFKDVYEYVAELNNETN